MTAARRAAFIGAVLLSCPITAAAQRAPLDRTQAPPVAPPPTLRVPAWTTDTLSNGALLIVSQKRDLPLVAFNLSFIGGRYQFEPREKVGVADLTAAMLAEGTTTLTGDQLADAQLLLGTSINVSVSGESGFIGFTALADKFAPAVELLTDMLANPRFPAEGLERLRARTLVQLTQERDQPRAIASRAFARTLYGEAHPYAWLPTEQTVREVTRHDVAVFHHAYFQPGRAVITIVGDVDPATVRRQVESILAAKWRTGGARPSFDYPAPPERRLTTIYLVDKPDAGQSVFAIGHPGPSRNTRDFYALRVMNTILGGLFQSRLMRNIREARGYSYGVWSVFQFGRGPGAFRAGGDIATAKTDSALIEFMRELRGVRGERPFTQDEITQAKAWVIQRLPENFASVNATASAISEIYVNGLPENYYQNFAREVNAVTANDLVRVAREYIDLSRLNIVIVGDKSTVESNLRATGIAPVEVTRDW